ncbi:MAG: C39 family peptidase [Clostridia bacterium]|nr:C39 family peptidase [Clostridia bacterium]MBQ2517401.1 C39 family peptidase [Clostridia bacterium]MBQ4340996.1 C39 family peptidase [Clostridia bacterium]
MKKVLRRYFVVLLSFIMLILSLIAAPKEALAYASSVYLTNPSIQQPKSNWCWAASGASCVGYVGQLIITPSDFSIAVKGNSVNNATASLSEVRSGLNSYSISSSIGAILTFQTVMYENDTKDRPIIAGLGQMNANGNYTLCHMVVISGYKNLSSGGKVWIMDPATGTKTLNTYSSLCNTGSLYWFSSIGNMNYTGI